MFQQERERASATRRSPRHRDRPDLHILAGPCLPGTFCRVLAEKNGAGRRGFLSHPSRPIRRFMFPIRHSGAAPMSDVLREQLVERLNVRVKGGQSRDIPLPSAVMAFLHEYLTRVVKTETEKVGSEMPLFWSTWGRRNVGKTRAPMKPGQFTTESPHPPAPAPTAGSSGRGSWRS